MPLGHNIKTGMMWMQSPQTERKVNSTRPQEMNVINDPAPSQSCYIACDRVIREDVRLAVDDIDTLKKRAVDIINDAMTAGIKVSIGYL